MIPWGQWGALWMGVHRRGALTAGLQGADWQSWGANSGYLSSEGILPPCISLSAHSCSVHGCCCPHATAELLDVYRAKLLEVQHLVMEGQQAPVLSRLQYMLSDFQVQYILSRLQYMLSGFQVQYILSRLQYMLSDFQVQCMRHLFSSVLKISGAAGHQAEPLSPMKMCVCVEPHVHHIPPRTPCRFCSLKHTAWHTRRSGCVDGTSEAVSC